MGYRGKGRGSRTAKVVRRTALPVHRSALPSSGRATTAENAAHRER